MIKAVIFDCFGVLLGNPYKERLNELEAENPAAAEEVRALNHASDMGILSREESSRNIAALFDLDYEEFLEEQERGEVRNQALLDYIATLKPHFKLGLLSNISSRERLGIRFDPGQLDALFNTVVASGDEGYVKPQPEIYQIAATRLGVDPSECVFIDDYEYLCDGAREVGMQAIHFQTTNQCIADLNALIDGGGKRD